MSLTKRRPGDEDWFYHAPLKSKKDSAQVAVPPASQIPGLSQLPPDMPYDDDPAAKRKWIRDTDTKYIKLAKQGGRQDLLRYRSPPDRTKGPVPYPRVDWFDHDVPQEEEEEPLPRTFALPEYMVHEEFIPSPQRQIEGKKRAPFSTDSKTVWQRDDTDPTDKRVRLPEIKRPQRRHKQKMPPPPAEVKQERRKQPAALKDHFAPKSRFPPVPHPGKEDPVSFGKLLSMGYQRDWISKRNDWEEQHVHGNRHLEPLPKGTEYQEKISKHQASGNKYPNKPARKDLPGHKGSAGTHSSEEKPVFKLSKFEKVGPKVSTRREPVHV
ncbi:uncharacterized protein C7orf57-like [Branchiostoma floridae x Branchiostoma japonicum]